MAPEDAIPFAAEPLLPPNSEHERRFTALMLLILGEVRPYGKSERRACGKALWRGKQHAFVLQADGSFEREYVPAGSQGGLAARLGCCVRWVDIYLRIARAARLVDVWQMPAKAAKIGQKGKKYGYAVFRWLTELPAELVARLRRNRRPDSSPAARETAPSKLAPAAAPAPAGARWTDEDEHLVGSMLERLRGPQRAPP